MTDTAQLRCTTTDGNEVSLADIVTAVFAGDADPEDYRVELTAADEKAASNRLSA